MSSSANRRAAQSALDRGRRALDHLDAGRPAAERRSAVRGAWDATEVALRSLAGGSPLAGKALVKTLRERQMLSLEQAHALVDFASARERAASDDYEPTDGDADVVRSGFRILNDSLNEAADIDARPMDTPAPVARQGSGSGTGAGVPDQAIGSVRRRSLSSGWILALIVILLVVIPAAAWIYWTTQRSPAARTERAAAMYQQGDREGARRAFEELAASRPNDATPHIYLGRIAREIGDMAGANRELQSAVRLEPGNALALREMGSFMLASNEPDVARRFYVRAIEADPTDRVAMGYLACSLWRLGFADQAGVWHQRAGPGEWGACLAQ